ncbi:MAG: TlpA family protein disulfide reductase [Saprospiraceae bacterium]|nr:TlpA family protein disulfide reductase [Saprospiraceae bacterium]
MVRIYLLNLLFFISTGTFAQNTNLPVYDFDGFQPYLQKNNDTIYVINFWATWCKPCLEELPFIEQIHNDQFTDPVKVVLVSLDFKNQIDSKLIPFLKQRALKSDVVVLDDPDANSWIDKVDQRWSGAIPATIIYKKERKLFFADAFEDYESIRKTLADF